MKKLYLVIIWMLFIVGIGFMPGNAIAATIDIEPEYCGLAVDGVANETQCYYEIDNSTAIGVTQEFRLTTNLIFGYVKAVSVNNGSDNFDFWLSNLTGQDEKSVQTYIYKFDKEFYYATGFSPTVNFRNTEDALETYFTERNDGTIATGTTYLLITYGTK
jgi:cadmium resistance protein CadD (predicted permease)